LYVTGRPTANNRRNNVKFKLIFFFTGLVSLAGSVLYALAYDRWFVCIGRALMGVGLGINNNYESRRLDKENTDLLT
jgi:hypothetical protein